MKIAVAQFNPTVGNVDGNVDGMVGILNSIADESVDLVVFPELVLTGYPPRDLLSFNWFMDQVGAGVERLLEASRGCPGTGILFGSPRPNSKRFGKGISNAALLIQNGIILHEQSKWLLPTYDVFDELRYFDTVDPDDYRVVEFAGEKLGISICEDAWNDPDFEETQIYEHNPIQHLCEQGATLQINITASPYNLRKASNRFSRNSFIAKKIGRASCRERV